MPGETESKISVLERLDDDDDHDHDDYNDDDDDDDDDEFLRKSDEEYIHLS